jgi:glycosyltransferase involved in cell wall biosynthesis
VARALAVRQAGGIVRIALVIGTLGRGGSERQIVEFVRSTHPRHAQCAVICLGEEGELAGQVREVGADVIALGGERLASPRVLARLARVLRRERFDVVYALLFWAYCLALPLAALIDPSACRVQGRRSLPDVDVPRKRIHRSLRAIANRCSHGVIANSLGVATAVASREPTLAGRIWVVPNGVRPHDHGTGSSDGNVRIVCVANLMPYKGHLTLLAALSYLPPGGWSVLLVGDGPEQEAVAKAIDANGLRERVIMRGREDDVPSLLSGSDIAVLPSLSEGMPNAVMEAMAHGLPVVATDVGGVRSLLGSGAGTIVAPGDAEGLGGALKHLIENPSVRREMGEIGRDLVRRCLSIEAMRDGTLNALQSIRRQSRESAERH